MSSLYIFVRNLELGPTSQIFVGCTTHKWGIESCGCPGCLLRSRKSSGVRNKNNGDIQREEEWGWEVDKEKGFRVSLVSDFIPSEVQLPSLLCVMKYTLISEPPFDELPGIGFSYLPPRILSTASLGKLANK